MNSSSRYELRERLRPTHFGVVHNGFDKQSGQEVRIFELRESFTADLDEWDRIWGQVQKLKSAELDNSVVILDTDENRRWVITEKLDGDLGQKLRDKGLPSNLVRSVLLQGLIALQSIHLHDVIHGDLRPESFVYQIGGMPHLTFSPGLVLAGKIPRRDVGLKYSAPELFKKAFGGVGAHTDLYMLGVSALEMLTGPKFDSLFPQVLETTGDRETAWLSWHASDEPFPGISSLLPEVPDDLATVLDRLLQKKVDDRYQSADEALGDLRESTIEFIPIEGDSAIKPLSRIKSKSGSDFFDAPDESPFPDVPASRPSSPLSLPSATASTPPVLAQTQRYAPSSHPGPPNANVTPPVGTPNPGVIPPRPQRQTASFPVAPQKQPRKSGALRILMFAVLGLLIGVGVFFWGPFGRSGLAGSGKIKVRITSEPAGAAVFVDGVHQSVTTPADLELKQGNHVIGLKLDGYEDGSRPLALKGSARPLEQLAFTLVKTEDSAGTERVDLADSSGSTAKTGDAAAAVDRTPGGDPPQNSGSGTAGSSGGARPTVPADHPEKRPPAGEAFKLPEGLIAADGAGMHPALKLPERVRAAKTAGSPAELELVLVAPQEFLFGVRTERVTYTGELEQSRVEIQEPFYIGLSEVTNAQYAAFADDVDDADAGTAWQEAAEALGDDASAHPVVLVSVDQAIRFAGWLAPAGRLPTEREWELAATGGQERYYPWESNTSPDREKCNLLFSFEQPARTMPVDALPKGESPWGLKHTLGNVAEWCADLYAPGYNEGPDDPGVQQFHVIRGGSFKTRAKDDARLTMRANLRPEGADDVGFRVVVPVGGK